MTPFSRIVVKHKRFVKQAKKRCSDSPKTSLNWTLACWCVCRSDLQHGDQQHQGSDSVHDASIVRQQGVTAAALPDVEILSVVVVTVVSRVVGHLLLDAGSGGAGVAAAEGHPVHQILPVHVAPDATKRAKQSSELETESGGEVRLYLKLMS